ncbi:MAG: hypothetical protein PVF29_11135 [Desulfobacterales bacterium]
MELSSGSTHFFAAVGISEGTYNAAYPISNQLPQIVITTAPATINRVPMVRAARFQE